MNSTQQPATDLSHKGHFGHFFQAANNWTKRVTRRQAFRKTFLPLLEEPDDVLTDIGYRRADIERALHLPLNVDALGYIEQQRNFHEEEDHHTRLKR